MRKRIIIVLLLLTLSNAFLFAKNLCINIDYAQFKSDSNTVVLDLFYSFPDSSLVDISDGVNITRELYFSVSIINNNNNVDAKEWIVSDVVPIDVKDIRNMIGTKNFKLGHGINNIKIFCKDVNDTNSTFSKTFTINAKNYDDANLINMSDIVLAQYIETEGKTSNEWNTMFKRDSLYVVPNPSTEFYSPFMPLNAYAEVYNINKKQNITFKVLDAVKREIYHRIYTLEPCGRYPISFGHPLDSVASGIYYLQACITKAETDRDSCFVSKKFYLINQKVAPKLKAEFSENEQFAKSEFATMNAEQVEQEFKLASPLASNAEKEMFNRLSTTEAKQRYLFTFWERRDIDSNVFINEALMNFHNRIDYANQYFSVGKLNNGCRTDRGRIIIKYGEPTTRDLTPEQGENRAYETWFYAEIQGGVYFYFVDTNGDGYFKLVSSTAKGEMYDQYWFDDYVPVGSKSDYRNRLNNHN